MATKYRASGDNAAYMDGKSHALLALLRGVVVMAAGVMCGSDGSGVSCCGDASGVKRWPS